VVGVEEGGREGRRKGMAYLVDALDEEEALEGGVVFAVK